MVMNQDPQDQEETHGESPDEIYERFMNSTTVCEETDRAHLSLTLSCNNNCLFCLQGFHPYIEHKSLEGIKREIDSAMSSGLKKIVLSGGEPTLHPDFIKIVKYCKDSGIPHIQTISNGRIFSLPKFSRSVVKAGLTEVTLSIHGKDPETHDELVNVPGAFEQIKRAVANLKQQGVIISVDIGIFQQNYDQLLDIVKLIYHDFGLVCDIDLIGPTLQGNARLNQDTVMPRYEDVEPHIKSALEFCKENNIVCWVLRVPTRYIGGFEMFKEGPEKLVEKSLSISRDLYSFPSICKGANCKYCRFEEICRNLEDMEDRVLGRNGGGMSPYLPINIFFSREISSQSDLAHINVQPHNISIDVDEPASLLDQISSSDLGYDEITLVNPSGKPDSFNGISDAAMKEKMRASFSILPPGLPLYGNDKRAPDQINVFNRIREFSRLFPVDAVVKVTRKNLSYLPLLAERSITAGASKVIFKYFPLYDYIPRHVDWGTGFTFPDRHKVFYDMSFLEPSIRDAIALCDSEGVDYSLSEFPFCVFSEGFIREKGDKFITHSFLTDLPFEYFGNGGRRQVEPYMQIAYKTILKERIKECEGCRHKHRCAGFDPIYLKYKSSL